MSAVLSRYWKLRERPSGTIDTSHLSLEERQEPELVDGQMLLKTRLLSLDATNRLWMSDMDELYMSPVAIGAPMQGFVLAEVMSSRNTRFKPGELLTGLGQWSDHLVTDGEGWSHFFLPDGLSVEEAFAILTIAGPTAYYGLLDIGQPKAGETVVVTAAAGAVGALVGQIAKIKGCRVVGIAGGQEKCRWLKQDLGFDEVIDYKATDNLLEDLKACCPKGIDVHFENVGGEMLDAALTLMNEFGRVVVCGLISMYNASGPVPGPAMFHNVIMKRLRIEGFVILDYADRYAEARSVLSQWMLMGKLRYRMDVMEGIEQSLSALQKLYTGENRGKMMVRYSSE